MLHSQKPAIQKTPNASFLFQRIKPSAVRKRKFGMDVAFGVFGLYQ
jgi:hypothetical protein